jgi:hypothetical protein
VRYPIAAVMLALIALAAIKASQVAEWVGRRIIEAAA